MCPEFPLELNNRTSGSACAGFGIFGQCAKLKSNQNAPQDMGMHIKVSNAGELLNLYGSNGLFSTFSLSALPGPDSLILSKPIAELSRLKTQTLVQPVPELLKLKGQTHHLPELSRAISPTPAETLSEPPEPKSMTQTKLRFSLLGQEDQNQTQPSLGSSMVQSSALTPYSLEIPKAEGLTMAQQILHLLRQVGLLLTQLKFESLRPKGPPELQGLKNQILKQTEFESLGAQCMIQTMPMTSLLILTTPLSKLQAIFGLFLTLAMQEMPWTKSLNMTYSESESQGTQRMILANPMSQSDSQCLTLTRTTVKSLADQSLGPMVIQTEFLIAKSLTVIQPLSESLSAQFSIWNQPSSGSPAAEGLSLTHVSQASGSVMLMVTTNALSCYSPCRILRRERKVTRPPRARTKIIQKSVSDTGTGVPLGLSPCRIPWLDREVTVPPIARMELMSDQMLMSEVVVVSLSSDYSDTLNALNHSQMCMVCTECLGIEGGHCRKTLLCSLLLDHDEVCDPEEIAPVLLEQKQTPWQIPSIFSAHKPSFPARNCMCICLNKQM